jgi:hypothetical protein
VSQGDQDAGADEDDFHALKRRTKSIEKEEASRERAEKLIRKRVGQVSSAPASTLPHPDRQALIVGADASPSQSTRVQKQPSAPAPPARGAAMLPRKTKVVKF